MGSKAANDQDHLREECENDKITVTQSYATRSTTLGSRPPDERISPLAEPERSDMLEAAAMILTRLDIDSYESAVITDSYAIMKNHTLPKSFPWNKPRAPLLQMIPRDIDDMGGVLHAGHPREHSAFGFNRGVFGFGAFDQGGRRKNDASENSSMPSPAARQALVARDDCASLSPKKRQRSEDPIKTCEDLLADYQKLRAAARRSNDPGVVELTVTLPPPTSLESALVSCQLNGILHKEPWLRFDQKSIRRAKAMVEAERAEISSHMPLYWDKIDETSPFNPPAFTKNSVETRSDGDSIDNNDNSSTTLTHLQQLVITKKRKNDLKTLVQSCTRKWNVSARVGGVSSRSSLFGPTNMNGEVVKNSNKIEPMYCQASFPSSVQMGKIVSLETAMEMDNDGLASSLGSYDCRAGATNPSMSFQAMEDITKKDTAGRAKKINVGRTRLIWSGIRFGNNNRIYYTSLTTGQKLDTTSYKRPREVKVAVSLNGKLLQIPPVDGSNTSKKATHQILFPDRPTSPEKISNSFSGDLGLVEDSIKNACISSYVQNRGKKVACKRNFSQIEGEYSMCMLDGEALGKFVSRKPKFSRAGRIKKDEDFLPMKYGATSILKYIPARFNCLPLDDGFFRTICEASGNLQPTSVHHLLNLAARNSIKDENLCSICWTGSETGSVLECVNCNLFAHSGCCYDTGKILSETELTQEEISGLQATGKLGNVIIWRCSVCQDSLKSHSPDDNSGLPSRKSQRTLKIPARFNNDADFNKYTTPKKKSRKPRPNPKCALCPHSGGAMSVLLDDDHKANGARQKQWVHEICRLWCTTTGGCELKKEATPAGSLTGIFNNPLPLKPIVCVICGTSELLNKSVEKKKTFQTDIKDDSQVSDDLSPGLIKCAAVGCSVMFHPMCATLVTRLAGKPQDIKDEKGHNRNNLSHKKRIDSELCQGYTLEMIELSREEGSYGNMSGSKKSSLIPVGFCGIHNPRRDPSFYGGLPAGNQLSSMISIPFQ